MEAEEKKFDAFEVLDLPRKVDLEDDSIESAWRELSRRWHPDAPGGDATMAARLNRAKELLSTPASRLRHWLDLQGESSRDAALSTELMEVFGRVGAAVQGADEVLQKRAVAATALGRAVLAASEWQAQAQLQSLLTEISEATVAEVANFPEINGESDLSKARSIAASLGFFEKWQQQIRDRLLRLMAE